MAYQAGSMNAIEAYTSSMPPVLSLSAATTGAGTAGDFVTVRPTATLVVIGSSGITAGAVTLQGSMDNTNWWAIGSPVTVTASTTTASVQSSAYARFFRAEASTTVVGGTVTAYVAAAG
jgi:hypothetical protein